MQVAKCGVHDFTRYIVPGTDSTTRSRPLWFGIILLPDFTLPAFSGLVDMLRLASDEGANIRPVRFCWPLIGEGKPPVRARGGLKTTPWEARGEPSRFAYAGVV